MWNCPVVNNGTSWFLIGCENSIQKVVAIDSEVVQVLLMVTLMKQVLHIVVKVSNRHKRPRNANTNFRDNRIWKLDHFSDRPDCVFSFELKNNIMLHDRRTPVLSCHVCIISYWWGKFEIQCKTLGHAFYINNFSVQERLTRESVYLYDGSKLSFP